MDPKIQTINEYRLNAPFQAEDSGFSLWTTAERKGRQYFIKKLLSPVYPDNQSLSEQGRNQRRDACRKFEEKISRLCDTINTFSDGNVVRITEFFRCDSHYYLVMPLIQPCGLSVKEIAALPLETKALVCRSAAHGLMQMHRADFIHFDIKESNVLLQKTATGMLSAKIIDYDSGCFASELPATGDSITGDQVYLAPELCLFICGEQADIGCRVDVFSMGVLFHQYLTGNLPGFDNEKYHYLHEAILDGKEPVIQETIPQQLRDLLKRMLCRDPAERCDISDAFEALSAYVPERPLPERPLTAEEGESEKTTEAVGTGLFHIAGDL